MSYVALYRRFRPQGFSELVGQEAVRRTLEQAIADGRVAHAYLFAGPRGTGKTSTAKIMARLLNCEHPVNGEPCGECANCRQIADGTSMDVYEIDAASNRGIDEIRELRDTVKFAAAGGHYKVYIIDEVHMLTTEAFNALLKTLEEPPERVVFILATTEAHKVPTTIKSRCQRYDFKRIPTSVIEARLQEVAERSGISVTPEALAIIAREADGGMRDALSLLDQCVTLCSDTVVSAESVNSSLGIVGREAVEGILTAVAQKNPIAAITAVDSLLAEGKDLKQLVIMLQTTLRRTMIFQAVGNNGLQDAGEEEAAGLARLAKLFRPDEFIPLIGKLHETLGELKWTEEPRLAVESTLLTLSSSVPVQPGTQVVFQPVPQAVVQSPVQVIGAELSDAANTAVTMPRESDNTAVQVPPPVIVRSTKAEVRSSTPAGMTLAESVKAAMASQAKTEKAAIPAAPKTKKSSSTAAGEQKTETGDDPTTMPLNNVQEAQQLWGSLINALRAENNSSLVSCLSQGEPDGMTDSFIRVRFASNFVKGRTERPDFRRKIEGLLKEISGKGISFVPTAAGAGGDAAKRTAKRAAKPAAPAVTAPAMVDAMKIFGEGSRVEVVADAPASEAPIDDGSFPDDSDMPPDLESDF
ncbi:MAG: DNA polymerase III subunit gamma/tau [Selenomonadaceae bacterium]|nr:DNA polymerase III subunit gamma/tau [Selenomonadaceae bacterium]